MGQVQQDMIDALRERVRDQERELARLNALISGHHVEIAPTPTTLSRRDEFAKAAMQGALSNEHGWNNDDDAIVLGSCMIADRMIAALDGEGGE